MKIAHVIFRGRYAGAEILARDLAIGQKDDGFSACIIGIEPTEDSFTPEVNRLNNAGVPFFAPLSTRGGTFKRTQYLLKTLRHYRPDLVIAHSILPSFYARGCKLLGCRSKLTTVLHSNSDFIDPKLKWTERLIAGLNDTVIAVSPEARIGYIKAIKYGPKPVTIPNGVRLDSFSFDPLIRDAVRASTLQVTESDLVILQVGRICEQKQQMLTMAALDILSKDQALTSVKMFFAGATEPNSYLQQFLNKIRDHQSSCRMEFLGACSNIPALLMAADICVMPSGWEAHPIAAIEAAASGIPLIVSEIAAFAPLRSQPGIYTFAGADPIALAELLKSIILSQERQRFDRELSHYSIDNCIKAYWTTLGLTGNKNIPNFQRN